MAKAWAISEIRTACVSPASSTTTLPDSSRIGGDALGATGGASSRTTSGAKMGLAASPRSAGSTSLPVFGKRRQADSWLG